MERLRDHTKMLLRQLEISGALDTLARHSFDCKQPHRFIRGIAVSSASRNKNDNSIISGGVQFALPTPLLWDHDWTRPLGRITAIRAYDDQLLFDAEVGNNPRMTWTDRAWQSIIDKETVCVSVQVESLIEPVCDGRFAWSQLNEVSIVEAGADGGAVLLKCWERLPYVSLRERNETVFWERTDL